MSRTPEQAEALPRACEAAVRNAVMGNRAIEIARIVLVEAVRTAASIDDIETIRERLEWIFEKMEVDNDQVRDAMRNAGWVIS